MLNSDCQVKLFEYLNVRDLIQLCKLDAYFYDLITSEIIAKKSIDLGVMDKRLPNNQVVLKRSTIETFDMFGKFLKKFVVRGEDFNLFLATIMAYCKPDRFTDVDLKFKFDSALPSSLHRTDQSLPFFSKLRRLKLLDMSLTGLYQHWLTKISENVTSIETLHLEKVDIVGGWLQKHQNLRRLIIHTTTNISLDDLASCYAVNPQLNAFEYKGTDDLKELYSTLSACCPRLQTFSDCHLSIPYSRYGADVKSRYKFLSQFKHLDSVTLTSYTASGHDLSHHLNIATLANISKFKVYMNWERPIVLSDEAKKTQIMETHPFMAFNNLKTVEIEILGIGDVDCDLRCEFIYFFVSQLKNIDNVKFVGGALTNVKSILQHATNIRRLCIAETRFRSSQLSHELRNIMRVLLRVPIRHPSSEAKCQRLFHLQVNERQWQQLQVYENTGRIMTTSIDSGK